MVHLYRNGFKPRYFVWIDHGESDGLDGIFYNSMHVDVYNMVAPHGQIRVEQVRVEHDRVHEMINDAFGVQGGMEPEQYFDEVPNEEARHFFDQLEEFSRPLCEGSPHSSLSVAVRLMNIKSYWNVPNAAMDSMVDLLGELVNPEFNLPKNFYQAKRFVSKLRLMYDRIHCCVNGCMLFYKTNSELENCKFCGHTRYKRTLTGKMVPVQAMHYLPLIPRLKRLYASMSEPRNVRLGLCSDGFTPFSNNASPYSCWPVFLTPYNLPPEMCMTSPYVFLSCVIPGPRNPKSLIDVYLQPLIDELKQLWFEGVLTYDISNKQNLIMRASLMWTINDFPAYGMLSGWMTAGKLALMDVKGKTKDYPKARMDIKEYCRRKELWLQELQNGKIVKPKASFSFTLDEKREIIEWVKNLRMPEGYALNLGKRADMNEGKLIDLCSGKLLESSLDRMEENILVTTTKLEKIFPCGFFDVMEHLPIHLVQEACLEGPVQTRWMYPFERKIGSSKQTIKQRGRIEGSFVQGHIGRETCDFYSYYFGHDVSCRRNRPNRNDEGDIDPLFPPISIFNQNGRGSKKRRKRGFTDMEMQSAVTHILLNCPEIQSYVNLFVNAWGNEAIYTEFSKWLRNYVYDEYSSVQHLQLVKEVALGPQSEVLAMNKYCVNGFKFQTEEVSRNKKTNNSGVYIQGDVDGIGKTIEYYGVIQEIIEVRYSGWPNKKIVLFRCEWFDPSHKGTKVDHQHNIIEVKHTRKYKSYDPFIIAQHAKQVYYASYPLRRDKADWWVVIKSKPVGRIEIDNVLDVAYQNDVAIVQQQVDVELETTLQHPQHILEEISDDEILNIEEEISENEENESFDDEEWDDNENETTEEKEWENDGIETNKEE
ncbi:hypothetical protein MTR67_002082 [Solanum verrucosum]|uniref:DUF4216 domain-containing protein n=1 Tax=Solanum verrucosum TaxID=315347 RepID=A0AAF0PPV4_SOLVR|nr:hypothetical protein MTR67_002082 [Solanum verrucosum]